MYTNTEQQLINDLTYLISLEDSSELLVQRGLAYRRLHLFDKALNDFGIVADRGDFHAVWKFRGETYVKTGNLSKGKQDFERYIHEHKVSDAFVLRHYAEILRVEGDFQRSSKWFEASLEQDSENLFALSGFGDCLRLLGKMEQALGVFEQVLSLDPRHSQARAGRGNILRVRGQFQDALIDFNISLEEDPDNIFAIEEKELALRGSAKSELNNAYFPVFSGPES